jgi:hypothetical protein
MLRQRSVLHFFLFLVSLSTFTTSFAQTVVVKKEQTRLKNEYADGFEAELQGTSEELETALTKLMKSFGKSKTSDNFIVVSEPLIQERKYTAAVYGVNKQLGNILSVWIGFRSDDFSKEDVEILNRDLEKLLHDFGVNFYREKIQKQIDESMRAAQAVEKQQQRLQNQNRTLNTRLEDNKREKVQLENSLVKNKNEFETLTKNLEKNKKDQDSVTVAGEQIKKVIEMHREKQSKVH